MKINTTPGETYIVLSTGGCTATTGAGKQIKKLAAGQDFFTAMTGDTVISDDNANVTVAKGELLSLLNTDSTGSGVQATLQFQPVTNQSDLPTPGENGVIYLVPNNAEAPNQYTEWVWTGAAYEQLGDVGVDLDGYVSKDDLGITSISEGETGPQITSNATWTTKAAQVDSLKVGNFVSANPKVNSWNANTINIVSTMIALQGGSSITWVGSGQLTGDRGRLNTLTVMTALQLGTSNDRKYFIANDGSGRLNKITLVGTLGWQSMMSEAEFNQLQMSDFGHPLAIDADSKAIAAGWVETSYVHTLLDVETPVLRAPGGSLVVASSLKLDVYKNSNGGTEVPTLTAHNIVCRMLQADIIRTRSGGTLNMAGVDIKANTLELVGADMMLGVKISEVTTCYIGSGCNINGPGWDRAFSETYIRLGLGSAPSGTLTTLTEVDTLTFAQGATIKGIRTDITVVGSLELAGEEKTGSSASVIIMESGTGIIMESDASILGPGWDAIVANIRAGAVAAAVAANDVPEEFTKLVFPPTGTATEEQDPSWITKSHILMQTNGGQLNMTQLTATLAYAAQTPLAIAKRTLWLSTSSGTGDAVQWPANAVFPDDQAQDKIQQLNSNSTYWFDITYVGGSDTVLIRKVCSWAATTGESGPTE